MTVYCGYEKEYVQDSTVTLVRIQRGWNIKRRKDDHLYWSLAGEEDIAITVAILLVTFPDTTAIANKQSITHD